MVGSRALISLLLFVWFVWEVKRCLIFLFPAFLFGGKNMMGLSLLNWKREGGKINGNVFIPQKLHS